MRREALIFMYAWLLVGLALAVGVGIAAGDWGMITGAVACFIGGAIVAPFVARMWR